MDIEQHLRESLASRDPPAAFEAAVMARVRKAVPPAAAPPRTPRWRLAGALAATVLAAAGGLHWHQERQRAAHDREQLKLALAITSQELNEVQQRLVRPADIGPEENGT